MYLNELCKKKRAKNTNKWKRLFLCLTIFSLFAAPVSAFRLCPDGKYHADGVCKLCPDGSYTTAPRCILAPDGKYIPDYGGGFRTLPDGHYSPETGSMVLCPDGKYYPGHNCELMPNGHYMGDEQ